MAGQRFQCGLENAGMTYQELARRIKSKVLTVKHWSTNGVPEKQCTKVAPLLGSSQAWLRSGEGAPHWYLRLVAQKGTLPITGLSLVDLFHALLDIVSERLVARLQTGVIRGLSFEGLPFCRSTFYRTQGRSYVKSLDELSLMKLVKALGLPSDKDRNFAFLAGHKETEKDSVEQDRRKNEDSNDRAIAQSMRDDRASPELVRRRLCEHLEALASHAEKLRAKTPVPELCGQKISDNQSTALDLLSQSVHGEGLISTDVAVELLPACYRFAGRLGLMGCDDISLSRAVAIAISKQFYKGTFSLNDMTSHLKCYFNFSITRKKKKAQTPNGAQRLFTEDELRSTLEKSGAFLTGKLWSTVN